MINQDLKQFVFIDIEVVPQYPDFKTLNTANPKMGELWFKKAKKYYDQPEFIYEDSDVSHDKIYHAKASFYPEFSKIVAIGLGMFIPNSKDDSNLKKYIKVFSNDNELTLLLEFKEACEKIKDKSIFGFNCISFDNPFICKRFIYNGYNIPEFFNHTNLKPWEKEAKVFDLMKVIQLGSYEAISIDLLCETCGIPSPKKKMDGSQVLEYYYGVENGMKDIIEYNHDDISSMMDMAMYLKNLK